MSNEWTFGRKVGAGFAAVVALAVVIGVVAAYALRSVVETKDRVLAVDAQLLLDAERLNAAVDAKTAAARGFALGREDRLLDEMRQARSDITATLARLRRTAYTDDAPAQLDAIERANGEHDTAIDGIIALRRTEASMDTVAKAFTEQMVPRRAALEKALEAFTTSESRVLESARRSSTEAASSAITTVIAIVVAAVAVAAVLAVFLTRSLTQRVGTAVNSVQSSASELQAAANQQATGAKEQSTAMNEITTTISELLATSRQIAESAQRVAQIAEETASSARTGETTVDKSHESIASIRRQVDIVVGHMLDLGKKSQQVGVVLEIVSELAEQTNILAINATIEAAGAGEAGKRFAVVADEIRKLADRVAASTKEIRGLIEDVRGAVNTTVMATESGSKAVDNGSRQFSDVAASFKQIAGRVSTTREAAREIELSTKQQSTAVEQVNVAIANVAQATKETEASSSQTLQTASQLVSLSRDLKRLVQAAA